MGKYIFISNSNKPTSEKYLSREKVRLSNVNRPCIEAAMKMGYEVYLGVNRANPEELECELDINLFDAHTFRNILDIKSNIIAYKNMMKILRSGDVEVIHCNTPIGGLIGRICGKRAKVPKVIYTAHGFHFYKGAPIIKGTIFKLAEKIMARYTDAIITMNEEDYKAAQEFKLRNNGKVYYVPGVGVNTIDYKNIVVDKKRVRSELGLNQEDIVLIAMGDLIRRKNYKTSIKAIANAANPNLHFLICGRGPELNNLQKLAKELGVERQIHFLGFRTDIKELLAVSDIFLFTSYQEGLPRSMMEAMASGLPCVSSKIRGVVDLIEDDKGGFLSNPDDIEGFADAINTLAENENSRKTMGANNRKEIKNYDIENVKEKIKEIYEEVL